MQAHIEALHHAGVPFGFKAPITLKSYLALKIIELLDAKSLKFNGLYTTRHFKFSVYYCPGPGLLEASFLEL